MLGKLFGSKTQNDSNDVASTPTDAQPKKNPGDSKPARGRGIIGGIKDKAVEKMLERQMKDLPPQQKEMLMNAIKENPTFFEMIAKKIQEEEKKNGGNQMAAAMKVMREHQGEMAKIMMGGK